MFFFYVSTCVGFAARVVVVCVRVCVFCWVHRTVNTCFTVVEMFGDLLGSWVPLYYEAKIVFIIFLTFPKFRVRCGPPLLSLVPHATTHTDEKKKKKMSHCLSVPLPTLPRFWWAGCQDGLQVCGSIPSPGGATLR